MQSVVFATLLLLSPLDGYARPALRRLRGGGLDGSRLAARPGPVPPQWPGPAKEPREERDVQSELSGRDQLRATLGVFLAVTNPIKWVSQRLIRMTATRAYVRWYVNRHVRWERCGRRLRVSRFRFLQHSVSPDEVFIRPPVLLEQMLALADFMLVPWVVYIVSERQVHHLQQRDQRDAAASTSEPWSVTATAVLTSVFWALRVASHPWDRAAAVLGLFGSTPLEKRAAGVTKEETERRLSSGALRLDCDTQAVAALALRIALVRWVRPDERALTEAYWGRAMAAGYAAPATVAVAAVVCGMLAIMTLIAAAP